MFIEVSMKRADNSGCHVVSTVNNSDSGDYLLMRGYKQAGIIMPSQPTKEEVIERIKQGKIGGGYTTCFKPGFHKDVRIWDFKSEYPSAIQTWNISPESYVETIHNENDAASIDKEKFIVTPHDYEKGTYHPSRVYKKEQGVIPKVVKGLVDERDKIKYTMKEFKKSDPDKYTQLYLEQYALKTDSNSIYGILAFPQSRYYSWELADSVTTCARATLKACYKEIEKWGCEVIGGDTDSSFVLLKGHDVTDIDNKFVDFLKIWADSCGCINNKLVFEYEQIFEKMLFVGMKNYAYIQKGDITIKGLAAIKSDSNPFAAKLQKKFIHQVLTDNYNETEWADNIESIYNKVYNQELTSAELLLVKALTKMPKEYEGPTIDSKTGQPKIKADGTIQMKSVPAHVKLAERMMNSGSEILPGHKVQYIVVKDKPILALSQEEYAKGSGTFKYKHKKQGIIDYEWEGGYDTLYYWIRIMKPLITVVYTYHKKLPDWGFNLTQGQLNKIMKKLGTEEE